MYIENNNEEKIFITENKIYINGSPLDLKDGDNRICRCQIRRCDPSVALDEVLVINILNNREYPSLYVKHEFDEEVRIKRKEFKEIAISETEQTISLDFRGRAIIQRINGKLIIKSDKDNNVVTMKSDMGMSEYNDFEITEVMEKSILYTLSIRDSICLSDGSVITFFKEEEQEWDWDEDEWI